MELPTIEPQDKLSRVPNALAFIVYRFLPILCLTTFACWFFQRHSFFVSGGDTYWMYIEMFASMFTAMSENYRESMTGCHDSILSRDFSPYEKLSQVRLLLESFDETRSATFPLGFRRKPWTVERRKREIMLQKERFAIYLSGSRQGIPSGASCREHHYLLLIWLATTTLIIRVFRPEIRSWEHFLGYLTLERIHHLLCFVCIIIMLCCFSFQFGIWIQWNVVALGMTARNVRYYCGSVDYERATENKRTELEWWIEGILRDNSDSFALAEERRRIIIAPLQRMVHENTFCDQFAMAAQKAHTRREMAPRICSDCDSAQCCLSKSVKLQ